MNADPFDDLLGLEEKFYDEGFQLGTLDGSKAGRIEGRVFGLEKGFEKYVESGRLHGKSLIWAGRSPQASTQWPVESQDGNAKDIPPKAVSNGSLGGTVSLPHISDNPRLEKHIRVLYALTEPVSLSTENTEDAISDFDDRYKRALGKIKIIERLTGEDSSLLASEGGGFGTQRNPGGSEDSNIEDVNILKARH